MLREKALVLEKKHRSGLVFRWESIPGWHPPASELTFCTSNSSMGMRFLWPSLQIIVLEQPQWIRKKPKPSWNLPPHAVPFHFEKSTFFFRLFVHELHHTLSHLILKNLPSSVCLFLLWFIGLVAKGGDEENLKTEFLKSEQGKERNCSPPKSAIRLFAGVRQLHAFAFFFCVWEFNFYNLLCFSGPLTNRLLSPYDCLIFS